MIMIYLCKDNILWTLNAGEGSLVTFPSVMAESVLEIADGSVTKNDICSGEENQELKGKPIKFQ